MWSKIDTDEDGVRERNGSNSVQGLARAECILDCDVNTAYAWLMTPTSRGRMQISQECGDLSNILLRENSMDDLVFSRIKRQKKPRRHSERLVRQIGFEMGEDNDDFVVAVVSDLKEKIDYGRYIRCVREDLLGCYRITSDTFQNALSQCKLVYTVQSTIRASGLVYLEADLLSLLGVVSEARNALQRDEEVTWNETSRLGRRISLWEQKDSRLTKTRYTPEQNERMDKLIAKFAELTEFEEIESSDHFVTMGKAHFPNDGVVVGRACLTVDSSIELIAANLVGMSREKLAGRRDKDIIDREYTLTSTHSTTYGFVVSTGAFFEHPVAFYTEWLWRYSDDKKFLHVYNVSIERDESQGSSVTDGFPPGQVSMLYTLEKIPDVQGCQQAKVTWVVRTDYGGGANLRTMNRRMPNQLKAISWLRTAFDRSAFLEEREQTNTVNKLVGHINANYMSGKVLQSSVGGGGAADDRYSKAESDAIDDAQRYLGNFENAIKKRVAATIPSVANEYVVKNGQCWGRSIVELRVPKEEVLAFLWNADSRCRWGDDDLDRRILETKHACAQIVYTRKRGGGGGASKERVSLAVWKHVSSSRLIYVEVPTDREMPVSGGGGVTGSGGGQQRIAERSARPNNSLVRTAHSRD